MRFVLNKESENNDILLDHNSKIEKKLETYGKVRLEFYDETGVLQQIERTYDPAKYSPFENSTQKNIADSFPILFLSQNEITKIAENENEQIKFIDTFFDFHTFQNKIRNIENELKELDRQFAKGLKSFAELQGIQKDIEKADFEISKITKQLDDPIYKNYTSLEEKDFALKKQKEFILTLSNDLQTYLTDIDNSELPNFDKPLSEDPAIKRNDDILNHTLKNIKEHLEYAKKEIEDNSTKIDEEIRKWQTTFQVEQKKYEEHIRNSGGDKKELERKRLRLISSKEDLLKSKKQLINDTKRLKVIKTQRENMINSLFKVYSEYSQERKNKCSKFQNESNGKLLVNLHESTNTDVFREKLIQLKKGSYFRDAEIEAICNNVTPYDFIIELLRYDAKKDVSLLSNLSTKTALDVDRLKNLSDFLLTQIEYEDLLKLQYQAFPKDIPEIKYKLNDGSYELIKNISTGQKCTAMLIIALSDGNFPIIIDQPEDSLDVRSIWEDMCSKLRIGKSNRQFIFTTHNSALAVASDTDKYTVIECEHNKGSIKHSGALDDIVLKKEVIDYLEGGKTTYNKKAEKYGYDFLSEN
jgi:ABC-type cobalamin/Fe3+-siderophores transport system ATPase subunit